MNIDHFGETALLHAEEVLQKTSHYLYGNSSLYGMEIKIWN
jgi:hypothetical protein